MAQQGVHYFPGHMQKALRQMKEYLGVIDLVVEILDARAPLSSRNPLINSLIGNKPRVILLSKQDYADEEMTKRWIDYFAREGIPAFTANLMKGKIIGLLNQTSAPLMAKKREKEAKERQESIERSQEAADERRRIQEEIYHRRSIEAVLNEQILGSGTFAFGDTPESMLAAYGVGLSIPNGSDL